MTVRVSDAPLTDIGRTSYGIPCSKENHSRKYVLITPAHNEESYIEKSIRSVVSQTLTPAEWIIVSDRSTDRTDKIIEKYAADYDFIKLVKLPPAQGRDFASKVKAVTAGWRSISVGDYKYIGNLDADVSFAPDYYESVIRLFEKEEKLGLAGGVILELIGTRYIKQMSSSNSVAGAVQLFRRKCFEEIGGYIPIKFGGEDSVAEITARMKGWEVKAVDELEVHHHRRVSGSAGLMKARFRNGISHYQLGYNLTFQLASTLYRMADRPFIIGSLLTFFGYSWASIKRFERPVSSKFIQYLETEQSSRLRAILNLKPSSNVTIRGQKC